MKRQPKGWKKKGRQKHAWIDSIQSKIVQKGPSEKDWEDRENG